jgi:hypothetical protein
MSTQKKCARNGFQDVDSAWKHLERIQRDLICSQSLSKEQSTRRKNVLANQGKRVETRTDRKYYHFVNTVDTTYKELCIIAFSRYQVDSTKKAVLEDFATRTGEKRGDIDARVGAFFADLRKHEAVRAPQEPSQGSAGSHESWYEFTHAELEGTIGMFGEAMAKRIKKVQMDQDWKAVTMHFPKNLTPESFCVLKLEIVEEYWRELAVTLFQIEVSRLATAFQVVHENGMVQTMPEFTHKGALEEDIVAVFDSEISSAITECTVRRRELAEGKSRTGCVSMTFAKSEGTVRLAMNLQRGVQIQKKLYTKNVA